MNCPICSRDFGRSIWPSVDLNGFTLIRCNDCGLVRAVGEAKQSYAEYGDYLTSALRTC